MLIGEIADGDPGDDFYEAKVTVLGEMMADEQQWLLARWEAERPTIPDTPTFAITSQG